MAWIIGGLFILNALVTVTVWRSPLYKSSQKLLQTAVIWAFPAVGALIVLMAWRSAREDPSRHRTVKEPPDSPESFSQRSAADGD